MGKFKPMSKMETTEPSVELKLKKGGKVKKMQMGGALPVAASPEMMPKRRRMAQSMAKPMMAAKPMARPMAQPMMSKKGGEVETPAMHKAEMKKMGKVEKELKQHEGKPASKAHRGLKKGGAPKAGPDTMGGLAGGISATRVNPKKTTGGVRNSNAGGFKSGGHVAMKHGGMDGYKTGGKMCKY